MQQRRALENHDALLVVVCVIEEELPEPRGSTGGVEGMRRRFPDVPVGGSLFLLVSRRGDGGGGGGGGERGHRAGGEGGGGEGGIEQALSRWGAMGAGKPLFLSLLGLSEK